jgi:thioredoxin 1
MALREFNQENFASDVLAAELPVLVDFWAPWCGPCKALGPVIEKVASEYEGKAIVGKLNVDEAPAIASQYSIMSIPSLLIFVKGQVIEQLVGLTTKEKIADKLNSVL